MHIQFIPARLSPILFVACEIPIKATMARLHTNIGFWTLTILIIITHLNISLHSVRTKVTYVSRVNRFQKFIRIVRLDTSETMYKLYIRSNIHPSRVWEIRPWFSEKDTSMIAMLRKSPSVFQTQYVIFKLYKCNKFIHELIMSSHI